MSGARFLMVVPYKARDLEGHSLVARHLEQVHGHHVEFSNGYHVGHKLRRIPADVLVLDHLSWGFKVEEARLARALGMRVAVLPTEGLVSSQEAVRKLAGEMHAATDSFDRYLCWGQYHQEALRDVVGDDKRLPIVGCARFDFYHPPLRSILPDRKELSVRLGFARSDAPLLLWATNTPYAHMAREKVFSRYVNKANWGAAEIGVIYHDNCEQFHVHSRMILELARRRPDVNVVIKVHPAEQPHPYFDLVDGVPNVRLAYDAPIRDFVSACDLLIHRGCTTATEAWLVDKPVIELQAGEFQNQGFQGVTEGCEIASDSSELLEATTEALSRQTVLPELLDARQRFVDSFYAGGNGNAAYGTASALAAMVDGWTADQSREVDRRRANELDRFERGPGSTFPYRVKRVLRLDPMTSLRPSSWLAKRAQRTGRSFVAEPPITRPMVEEVWADLDRSLAEAREEATEAT